MNITVTTDAKKWFKEEMQVKSGEAVRFYVRYGGSSPLHDGFSLGVAKDEPAEPAVSIVEDGITFFVEEKDIWYFDGHDLQVNYNESLQEPHYDYIK
ncbi:HesB/YadR/YfhF family protein [Domibacillus enclensis]|uniref:Uncharacterized protein YneR n=1 Tax=Domibacillus enclensis TaxID=1017273 RepID=A0A1N6NBG4_9BACI|nr:HesB/YadR/YfhF family protein [Domibacillus enclensis]OXS79993.1 hypothetical protein B1B05_00455 [Domibacillus enclensis]SIP89419.1 Uncharacterized protein YneR [Domibacillus enclensis]